jgi:hypothetical protein
LAAFGSIWTLLDAFGRKWPELAGLDVVPAEGRRAVNAARNGAGGKAKIHDVKQRLVRTHMDPRQHCRKLQFHRPAPACWTHLAAFGSFWQLLGASKKKASQATTQPTIKFDISNLVKSEQRLGDFFIETHVPSHNLLTTTLHVVVSRIGECNARLVPQTCYR